MPVDVFDELLGDVAFFLRRESPEPETNRERLDRMTRERREKQERGHAQAWW